MQDIVVIGGGASGMAAAVSAARAGASVTILEHNDILGKKLLSTGNGRCNLTNLRIRSEDYRSDDPEFAGEFLEGFDSAPALEFLASVGIYTKCRGDYVYPLCDQASAVREAFDTELLQLGVRVVTDCHAEHIRRTKGGFLINCQGQNKSFFASKVILAAGSKASDISGSDGSGYALAKELGHSLSPVVPALAPLVSDKKCFRKLAGIRTLAAVSLFVEGRFTAEDMGELQLTDYGISGIPVFQISRYAAKALQQNKNVTVQIDFLPHIPKKELYRELHRRRELWGKCAAQKLLNTIFPSKLIPVLLAESGIERQVWAEKISEETWRKFADCCKCFEVPVSGTKPFSRAQVCAGGVKTAEVSPRTMESKLVKGLFLTGELLDIDGICGGYNLHFAWGSGIRAGQYAAAPYPQTSGL